MFKIYNELEEAKECGNWREPDQIERMVPGPEQGRIWMRPIREEMGSERRKWARRGLGKRWIEE